VHGPLLRGFRDATRRARHWGRSRERRRHPSDTAAAALADTARFRTQHTEPIRDEILRHLVVIAHRASQRWKNNDSRSLALAQDLNLDISMFDNVDSEFHTAGCRKGAYRHGENDGYMAACENAFIGGAAAAQGRISETAHALGNSRKVSLGEHTQTCDCSRTASLNVRACQAFLVWALRPSMRLQTQPAAPGAPVIYLRLSGPVCRHRSTR